MNKESEKPDVPLFAAHNTFSLDCNSHEITISSAFDNGNLARVEMTRSSEYSCKGHQYFDFRIWSAVDNLGDPCQSKVHHVQKSRGVKKKLRSFNF